MIEKEGEELDTFLERWASNKYAELSASPTAHGGGGPAGLGVNEETGRFEKLDGFYVFRRSKKVSGVWTKKTFDVRDYWTADGLKQEAGYKSNACYSRRGLRYPFAQTRATLPDFSGLYRANLWFCGFELGCALDWGLASFMEREPDRVYSVIGGQGSGIGGSQDDVSSLLPSDYLSADHHYSVKVNDGFVEYAVDGELVAVYVRGRSNQSLYTGEPYVVRVVPIRIPSALTTLFELTVEDPEGTYPEYTVDITPNHFRWSSGGPTPSRTYRLYDEAASTLMTSGTYDSGASHKSHPVPVQGYDGKTLLFRADTDSVTDGLRIEVFTQEGNWRLYDAITASANELESYIISGNFPLVRIGYEPSADGASITDAEIHLQ